MDLVKLPILFRHWWKVFVSVVVVTIVAMGLRLGTTSASYEARVRLVVTAPPFEDVQLLDTGPRPASYARDNATLARNNLTQAALSSEVRARTVQQLGLAAPDSNYTIDVRPVPDSDFVDVLVSARSPAYAQAIANAHVAQATAYYGQLRAKPITAMKEFLSTQVAEMQQQLASTERAPDSGSSPSGGAAGSVSSSAQVEAQQKRDAYQLLLRRQTEATLAERNALQAVNIQVVEPATVPTLAASSRNFTVMIALAVVGSLGVGLVMILVLESLFHKTRRSAADADPASMLSDMLQQDEWSDLEPQDLVPAGAPGARTIPIPKIFRPESKGSAQHAGPLASRVTKYSNKRVNDHALSNGAQGGDLKTGSRNG